MAVMALTERSAVQGAQRIADELERDGLSYAIGGALALAVAGVPRGTAVVVVNVFVTGERVSAVVAAFSRLGMTLDAEAALARAKVEGMFVARWDGMRIDVFVPSIPFSREAERTRVRVTDSTGWSGWFLSAEAIAVFKLLFFRGKDIVDLEHLVTVRPELDRAYVRRWIAEMMGDDDERTRRWDDIVARFGAA